MSREEEFETWLKDRPPAIAALARRMPPWKTYNLIGDAFKMPYTIVAYQEPVDGSALTIKAQHPDRILHGITIEVFGMTPESLEEAK